MPLTQDVPGFVDPLAADLWRARRLGRAITDGSWPKRVVDVRRGKAIAAELYDALEADEARFVGWKIGASDAALQTKLGTDRPFFAPIFDAAASPAGKPVRLATLVAPRLEAELAVVIDGSSARLSPCIEIADCRIAGWDISIGDAIADFGLQGQMIFGTPVTTARAHVDVTVVHDGVTVVQACPEIEPAIRAGWEVYTTHRANPRRRQPTVVATGSVIAALPLSVGSWSIDFDGLGRLAFEVEQ
jgi:2-keto-4-pentenoate hydratase